MATVGPEIGPNRRHIFPASREGYPDSLWLNRDLTWKFAQWAVIVPQNLEMERSYWLR